MFKNRNQTGKHWKRAVFTKRAPEIRILLNAGGDMAIARKPLQQSTADVDAVLVESTGVSRQRLSEAGRTVEKIAKHHS